MKEEGEEKGESGMDRHGGKDQGRETSPQNKQKILDAKGEVRLKSRSGKTDEPNWLSEETGGAKGGLGIPRQAFPPAENRSKLTSLFRQPTDWIQKQIQMQGGKTKYLNWHLCQRVHWDEPE